jgi:RNA polymerase sigma-70 factor (ECF subfamily)
MTSEDFKNNLMPLKNKMFRLAYRLLSNRQEAEDAVQETYLKIWNMRNNLEKYDNVDGLMMTMTRNLCLDKLKSKKNKFSGLDTRFNAADSVNPHQQSELSDDVRHVKQLINKLPEQQKTIIQLRDVEGYEFDEILNITGFDLNYVRVNLSRGRKKIKEEIQKIHSYETT